MNMETRTLHVAVYGGKPRGGKGSAVGYLGETRGRVATMETGADYRAMTKHFLHTGDRNAAIEVGMPPEVIERRLAQVSFHELQLVAGSREAVIEEYGFDSLYESDVNALVSNVAAIEPVRRAIKADFVERVEGIRDGNDYDVLAVDGRNLEQVIKPIEGTDVMLRTFVECHPIEAAYRECMRNGIDPHGPEGQAILSTTIKRSRDDAGRKLDPVQSESDALIFQHDSDLLAAAAAGYADKFFEGDVDAAYEAMGDSLNPPVRNGMGCLGIGAVAAASGKQVLIDTTAFSGYGDPKTSKAEMLDRFGKMFDAALDTTLINS